MGMELKEFDVTGVTAGQGQGLTTHRCQDASHFEKKRNRDRGTVEAPAYALYSPGPGDLSLEVGPKRAELPKPKEEQVRRSDCTWPPTLARSW